MTESASTQSNGPETQPESLQPLIDRLRQSFSQALTDRIVRSMADPKRTAYFLNPLAPGPIEFDPPGEPLDGLPGCYVVGVAERVSLLEHPGVEEGRIYPINPASVLAARSLDLQNAAEVLDLAAAPGGKTLLMAAAMENRGRIAAVEPVRGRFHRMRANLARCHVSNVQFYQADGRGIGRKVPERFDAVLLDAPCASEARIRLDVPDSFRHWKPRKVKESARKQKGLIRSAYAALASGGELVYCTCSFSVEENEQVVDHLLAAEPSADLLPVVCDPLRQQEIEDAGSVGSGAGWLPGITSWQARTLDPRLALSRRVLPDDLWDGFFVARIRKG